MIPGQQLKPEDLLAIAKRRSVAFFIPFVVIALASSVFIYRLPNLYRSSTLILVVPQRVPESYVRSTVTTRIDDRLRSINQQILSRTQLEPVVREFNLYPAMVKSGLLEDVIDRMRRDIDVQTVRGDAFHISFTSADPRTAMKVTERLASMYIDENLRERELLADGTNQFLDSQLIAAKERLIEHEKKLEQFKLKNAGELPTQVQSNLQVLNSAQLQIQSLTDSISRDNDRRVALESLLADAPAQFQPPRAVESAATSPSAAPRIPRTATAVELETAHKTLDEMRQRLKPGHPDVVRMNRLIVDLQKKLDDETALTALAPAPDRPLAVPTVVDPAETARLARFAQTQTELVSVGRQIGQKEQDLARLRGVAATYQARVDAAPSREADLTELTRDYETLQRMYTTLLTKKEDAQVAANLERHEIGEQFKILDPARMPEKPFSPDRRKLYAVAAAVAFGIGVVIAGFLEYRDTTLTCDNDVVMALSLPVLALIPPIVTADERRKKLRRRVHLSLATVGMAGLAAIALVWVLRS